MAVSWARRLRDQCKAAGVPFFFKKVGGNVSVIPEDLMVREYPG
jgi:protein gp37